jgi:hypothetical protein
LVKTTTRSQINDAIKLKISMERQRLNDALLKLRISRAVTRNYELKLDDVELVALELGLKCVNALTCEEFLGALVKAYPDKSIMRKVNTLGKS